MIERFYKPDSSFVYVRFGLDIDGKQVLQHMLSYNKETKDRIGLLELCDCRTITSLSTTLTTNSLVQSAQLDITEKRVVGGKLAILVPNKLVFGMARAFEIFARESGRAIGVFYELDEAIEFLNTKESVAEITEFIKGTENT